MPSCLAYPQCPHHLQMRPSTWSSGRLSQPTSDNLSPFQTEHQAEMSQRLVKICRAVDVVKQAGGDIFGRRDVAEACVQVAASSPGSFMRRMLLDAMMKVIVLQCEDEGRSYPMVSHTCQLSLFNRDSLYFDPPQKEGKNSDCSIFFCKNLSVQIDQKIHKCPYFGKSSSHLSLFLRVQGWSVWYLDIHCMWGQENHVCRMTHNKINHNRP